MHPDNSPFTEETLQKRYDLGLLRRLLPLVARYKFFFLGSIFLVTLMPLLDLSIPIVTRHTIDRFIVPVPSDTAPSPNEDPSGALHHKYTSGLNRAVYNYMHHIGLDWNLQEWFDFQTPSAQVDRKFVEKQLRGNEKTLIPEMTLYSVWTGGEAIIAGKGNERWFKVSTADMEAEWQISDKLVNGC